MDFNPGKIKKFFLNAFRGNRKSGSGLKNNVRWEAVLEEDKGEAFEERKSLEPVASFPEEVTEHSLFVTNVSVSGDNVRITRASVYVPDDDEPFRKSKETDENHSIRIYKVNSNSRLVDMDAAALTLSESETSVDDFVQDVLSESSRTETEDPKDVAVDFSDVKSKPPKHTNESGFSKMRDGSDLSAGASRGAPFPSKLPHNVENKPRGPPKAGTVIKPWNLSEEPKFESSNSLNIEKELKELMGALYVDAEDRKSPTFLNEIEDFENCRKPEEGSNVNLAFVSTEPEGDEIARGFPGCIPKVCRTSEDYWKEQRIRSKSFAGRYKLEKLTRREKQRNSMSEVGSCVKVPIKTKSEDGEAGISGSADYDNSPLIFKRGQGQFLRLAYERSSAMEPKVTSTISLPQRPRSALENRVRFPRSSASSLARPASVSSRFSLPTNHPTNHSQRLSEDFDECIDWSWLEEAMKSLDSESCKRSSGKDALLRVDAGCQTHSTNSSWERAIEERLRGESPSPPVLGATATDVTSVSRVLESRGCDEEMPRKYFVEGPGTIGVSTWLRQSMRRIRHFNLEDPSRIQSAPPDSLRPRLDIAERDSAANQVVINNGRMGNEVVQQNQRPRSEESRSQRRRPSRVRPSSAPARRSFTEGALAQRQPETEPATSFPPSEAQDNLGYESDSTDRHPSPRGRRRHAEVECEEPEGRSPLGPWPHGLSSVLAGLGCTLGLFNISRFAVLSIHFGCNFILQFLILSLILGVPLLAFHAALGQTLGAGPVDMWKISPFFQGIGIALLLTQALIGMYSIVGVSWMFVYFRDSFITKQDAFRWAEPFRHYREDNIFASSILNRSGRLEETVPDYLNGVVLQRHGLASPENAFGHLKFQLTFNLAVVWMIVFVSLSKGLRSYGKVVYVFSVVPVLGILVLSSKLLGLTPLDRDFFPQTEWSEFFLNAKSWISAVTEVMLTWNLLGAATMQVASHNRCSKKLWRDVATITLLTVAVLILAAFLGNACHQLLILKGYAYVPSSFERISTYSFLRSSGVSPPPSYAIPIRHMAHGSLVAGEKVGKPGAFHESGYQVVRLATELVPATLAVLDGNYLSPFWAVLFYFTLILFGIAQQLAIWHCVITGIMAINAPSLKCWETTITFFTCAAGFILGLPMTTELGIFVVYFLDYCLGGGWWVILLTLMEICAVLMVRGRPYSGENISVALFGKTSNCISLWAVPLLTFAWNVIMPVALLVTCITIFKSGGYRDLWLWKCGNGDYWPLWTRQVGVFVQVIPLLCIPIVAVVQSYRYLSKGPADILDRLANLYRPTTEMNEVNDEENTAATLHAPHADSAANGTTDLPPTEDPPPKYTPPPSYSTATGARIAKLLRQSIRRSVRRIQSALAPDFVQPPRLPPPDYSSVLVEMNQNSRGQREIYHNPLDTSNYTAADVAQVLGCSFRRTNNPNAQTSHNGTANNTIPQNLVTPHRNQ